MKPSEIINTERLILRKPRMDDAPAIFTAYAQDRSPKLIQICPRRIEIRFLFQRRAPACSEGAGMDFSSPQA